MPARICLVVYLSVHLSVGLSIHPNVCWSVCWSIHPYVCLSVCWSVHPYVCLSVCWSVHPSIRMFVFFWLVCPLLIFSVVVLKCFISAASPYRIFQTATQKTAKLWPQYTEIIMKVSKVQCHGIIMLRVLKQLLLI